MPNWCNNVLTLKHNDPAMIARAVNAFEAGNLLNEFIPMPDELRNANAPCRDEELAAELVDKYGYPDWYEWSYANWGCKWDIGGSDATVSENGDPNQVALAFDSPWCPPIEGYGNLEKLGFGIDAFYYEGGIGFCGRFKAGADECHELAGNSAWVRRNIPCEIDEAFAISDNMEEWENETPPRRRKGGRRMQKLRRLLAHARSCMSS
jgi:hypothetical protein